MQRTTWQDNIKTWTGLSLVERLSATEDRSQWKKIVHVAARPRTAVTFCQVFNALLCVWVAGSQASLIKSGLASSASSSVAASKRTLTSHDGVVTDSAEPDLPPMSDLLADARSPPSYLRVSRCVGGYSTFTSYSPDRRLPHTPRTNAPTIGDEAGVRAVAKGGQQCCVTLVDDVVADVRTLSNGSGPVVDAEDHGNCTTDDVTREVVDGMIAGCRTSASSVKVGLQSVSVTSRKRVRSVSTSELPCVVALSVVRWTDL